MKNGKRKSVEVRKKQLFILIVFAIFVFSVHNVFGQATNGSAPRPVACTDNALNPIAGKPYNYRATVNPTGGAFQWWAQKGTTFMANGVNTSPSQLTTPDSLIYTSPNYGMPGTIDSVTITWSGAVLAATTAARPTFVVVQYDAPSGGCANNMKVYKIEPKFAFVVDIKNVNHINLSPKDYDASESQCVSPVMGAVYNGVSGEMVMDYGKDTLYFEVVAANFTNYWIPTFHLDGIKTGQSASMDWFYTSNFSGATASTYSPQNGTTGSTLTFSNSTQATVQSTTNTNIGVSIYARVIVQHNRIENLALQDITLSVEGVNAEGLHDVNNSTCAAPTTQFEDLAMQSINPRPTVTPASGAFVPQTP